MLKILIALHFLFIALPLASADIYKYTDENGVIYYTDAPFGKKPQQVIREKNSDISTDTTSPATMKKDYSQYIHKAAAKYNLEPDLIKAVIKTESNGNHRAISRKGAMGLMQLMPSTANDLNVLNPFNPEENIDGGSRYLRYLLERFNGNVTLALAAYNSGPKTVEKYGSVPPIQETRQYVKRIMSMYNGNRYYGLTDRSQDHETKATPIYRIVLEDGTILFTNATLGKNNKTRL